MDDHDQLERALRAEADQLRPQPRLGLPQRVHARLDAEQRASAPRLRLLPWVAMAAGIVAAVVLAHLAQRPREAMPAPPRPLPTAPALLAQLAGPEAPLAREWSRMRADADATAAFLIGALPASATPH